MKKLLHLPVWILAISLVSCFPGDESEEPAEPESTESTSDAVSLEAADASEEVSESESIGEPSAASESEAASGEQDAPVAGSADTADAEPAADQPAATGGNPMVLIATTHGDIRLELFPDKAPMTVENFLSYVENDFYADTVFHRVIEDFMIQGGGFALEEDGQIAQKPTDEPVENEAKNGLRNARGTVAMARTAEPHSATSQFFINHKDNGNLDYPSFDGWGYTVFGEVVEGMDVVDKIAGVPTTTKTLGTKAGNRPMENVPEEPIVIESVSVVQ